MKKQHQKVKYFLHVLMPKSIWKDFLRTQNISMILSFKAVFSNKDRQLY